MVYSKGEETRERILEVAEECFAREGYDGAGVAEICRRAGVTKGAFYHHFSSKQALFMALFRRWLEGLETQMEALGAGALSVPEALERMAAVMPQIFEAGRGRLPLFLEFWVQATRDPEIWELLIEPYRRYREYFAALVQRGIAEGSIRPMDADTVARTLVSMAVGLVLQGVVEAEKVDWGAVAQEAVRIVLDGLRPIETDGR